MQDAPVGIVQSHHQIPHRQAPNPFVHRGVEVNEHAHHRALVVTAAAVVMGLALRKFLGRWLPEDDPRRQLIAQAMLYGGTFIVIAASVWLRHR
jgi:hypothetical protein